MKKKSIEKDIIDLEDKLYYLPKDGIRFVRPIKEAEKLIIAKKLIALRKKL